MFKRGGSSFQSQGTGITSPYDTPRKNYKIGSWGEWEEKTREATKDPRSDWSYAAQGFGHLGDPYKESGEAKMISEMLHAGAGAVRGSKEKATDLETKGELALLESQAGRMLSDEERAWKEEQAGVAHERDLAAIREKAELGVDVYKDLHPEKRYDFYITKWRSDVKDQHQGGGIYTHPGWKIASKNIPTFVEGEIEVRNAKKSAKDNRGKSVHPEDYKEDGSVDLTLLSENIVYFDPMSSTWFTVNNPGPSATPNFVASFTDGLVDLEEFKASGAEPKPTGTDLAPPDGDQKKIVKKFEEQDYSGATAEDFMPKAGTDVIEESIKTAGQTGEDITKFWEWVASPKGIAKKKEDKLVKKADGGRIGYAEGDIVEDPLDNLKAWWNDQAWNNEG